MVRLAIFRALGNTPQNNVFIKTMSSSRLASFALVAVLIVGPARAADPSSLVSRLQPHRVVYSLNLKSLGTGSGVVDARGVIAYEFAESCDGWQTKHTFRLGLTRQDSAEKVVRTDYSSWESKDGLSFRFTTRTTTDGQETENRSGRASLERADGKGRAIVEGRGARKEVPLPVGTVFPTWHTLLVLASARAGEPILWRRMFDGSSEGKLTGIHAVIMEPVAGAKAEPAALMAQPAWRYRATYFDPPQVDKERPTYQIEMTVNEAGVTTQMTLDYEEFVLEAAIERIEPLPRARCP
jgi:hypothetical protein